MSAHETICNFDRTHNPDPRGGRGLHRDDERAGGADDDPDRDAIPEPDYYQIRGYAVLEGTAKNFGGPAHVTVPRKYSGKRVKIVVLEP